MNIVYNSRLKNAVFLLIQCCFYLLGHPVSGQNATSFGSQQRKSFVKPMYKTKAPKGTSHLRSKEELKTYVLAGHQIGFSPEHIILASSSRMLKIKFANAMPAIPVMIENNRNNNSDKSSSEFTKATYTNLWNGIDAVYETVNGGILKSTYTLDFAKYNTNVNDICLAYNRPISIDKNGQLIIDYENGTYIEKKPIAWQNTKDGRKPVSVSFTQKGEQEIGFCLGEYIKGIPVVIDPTLTWNTFLGGSGDDNAFAMDVDVAGNVYIGGYSNATWGSSPINAHTGNSVFDGFVAKLDNSGNLIWHTFMGGNGADIIRDITLDGSGNIFVCGYSAATWGSSPVRSYTGSEDGFVVKLNNNGARQWHTFLGGSSADHMTEIALDANGNSYVAGKSDATWGSSPVNSYAGGVDGLVVKLNSSGALQWHTFFGSSAHDYSYTIAMDGNGNIFSGGESYATWGSPVRAYTTSYCEAYVVKLNNSGVRQWHTFLGGSNEDYTRRIVADGNGNAYVCGWSLDTWGSPIRSFQSGNYDGFVAKLNSSGTLKWNTFVGGSNSDNLYHILLKNPGQLVIGGYGAATWGSPEQAKNSGTDAFVFRLDTAGALQWNTFAGGSGSDYLWGMALDTAENIYISGRSSATWGSPVLSFTSTTNDAFVAKIGNASLPVKLLYFKADAKTGVGRLTWATASELNNDYFEIQKSRDGKKYTSIGKIMGAGSSQQILNYSFNDSALLSGVTYYRLKQIDYNGAFEYSEVVVLRLDYKGVAHKATVSPNPFNHSLNIEWPNANTGPIHVQLNSVFGASVNGYYVTQTENGGHSLHTEKLPAGIYILTLNQDGIETYYKVIKN